VVDLPEPLSPASPRTSPSSIAKLTLSTACTLLRFGEKMSKRLRRSGNSLTRSRARTRIAMDQSFPGDAAASP